MRSLGPSMRCSLLCCALLSAAIAGCTSGMRSRGPKSGGLEIVEGGAVFRYYDTDAKKVYLVGDFNNWSPAADPMADKNSDGEWTLFYPLAPGRYEYKFVIDGMYWIPDPANPNSAPDGFGGSNSVVVVPEIEPAPALE